MDSTKKKRPTDHMPTDNVTPRELWDSIARSERAHRIVEFPRKGPDGLPLGELSMVVLMQQETIEALAATERRIQKLFKESGGHGQADLHNLWSCCELLFRCCRKADDISKPLFPTVEDIAKHLAVEEIDVLVTAYNMVNADFGPIVTEMGQEEMDAWVEKLAKGGSSVPFALLSMGMQRDLMRYMASRLWNSQTDSSSSGTPLVST